jgi:glycosyltransferase involved in cell wall biosynthesis
VLSRVDRLIVNTDGAAKLYREKYPQLAARIIAIPNGYDELPTLHLLEAGPEKQAAPFRIMHVGNFYGPRNPVRLLEALAALNDPEIEFVHVGSPLVGCGRFEGHVRMRLIDAVPRAEALALMQSSSLLYLKQGFEPGVSDYVAVGAKTYEYLATGLPILADCPEGDNARIVADYCSAPYVVTSDTKEDLAAAVRRAKTETSDRAPQVLESFVEEFDRRNLTRALADCFSEIC